MKSLISKPSRTTSRYRQCQTWGRGIRDIEFIVQSFQLIYGGRVSDIKVKTAYKRWANWKNMALSMLWPMSNWHKPIVFTQIGAWYPSHQWWTNPATTQDAMQRHQLAQVLGFADWAALLAKLNEYRQNGKIPFDELVSDRQQSDEQLQVDHQHNLSELEQKLSADNKDKLNQFWQNAHHRTQWRSQNSPKCHAYPILINGLLHSDLSEDAINLALPRMLTLLEAVSRRSIYLVMFAENQRQPPKLIPMLAASPWIASELVSYPVLLDSFIREKIPSFTW